jgi:polysaccharide biosynthesis transport protein
VLPVAQLPSNPAEVIASAAFLRLLDTLGSRFDRIIFDSPPCQVASDSLLLSNRMNAVVFVIHAGVTGLHSIQTAIKHLRAAQAPLLGTVLNMVDAQTGYGYNAQYYNYGVYGR